MPPSTNSIGTQDFIALQGTPQPPRTIVELDQRPGVDGTQITDVGKKGVPFRLLSQVDAMDYEDAHEKLAEYTDLVDADPVTVIIGGYTLPYQCKVLSVEATRIQAIRASIGGLNAPSGGWIEAMWDLIGIEA